MNGKEFFKKAKAIIINAKDNQDANFSSLEDLGFSREDLNKGELSSRVPNDVYTVVGDDNEKVEVKHWAYDPSTPFASPQSDINKVYLKRFEGEKVADLYDTEFSDS